MDTAKAFLSLTSASIKMYVRNVTAIFFTLFIPVLLIVIFGLLNNGKGGQINLSLTNYSHEQLATNLVDTIKKIDAFKVEEVPESTAADKLGKGKTDLQVIIPTDFGKFENGRPVPANVQALYNEGRPQQGQTASLVLGQVVTQFNNRLVSAQQVISLQSKGVKTNNLGVIDFLVPGIMAMSIMQLGIFSVAFGFISYKTSGALRRLQATPVHPVSFILAQSIARLIIGVLQVGLLLGLGISVFHMHLVGSITNLMLMATLGTIVFLAFGFCIAGWAKDENQAAPVANLITFPMLFLSGVFFSRDGFPTYLKTITNYFPLTYLADAMHRIANEGASLWTVRSDMLGLVIWGIVVFFIATRLFRWE